MLEDVDEQMDRMALAAIYQSLPEDVLLMVAEKDSAKLAWETLKTMHDGVERVKEKNGEADFSSRSSSCSGNGGDNRGRGKGQGQGQGRGCAESSPRQEVTKALPEEDDANLANFYDEEPILMFAEGDEKINLEEFMQEPSKEEPDVVLFSEEKFMEKLPVSGDECNHIDVWYLDNGASNHMKGHREKLNELDEKITGNVKFKDGNKAHKFPNSSYGEIYVSRDSIFEEEKKWEWCNNNNKLLKRDSEGNILKHKARLVAKGYVQKQGVDVEETFAPVAKLDTVRLILVIAAHRGWEIHHLDVKSAFLNGDIEEEVYVAQHEGFIIKNKEHKVYRLYQALYGLRQAPRAWNTCLNKRIMSLGFMKCSQDQAVYTRNHGEEVLIVGIYVEDLIVTGSSIKGVEVFKNQIMKEFKMSDLRLLSYYLGIEVDQKIDFIEVKQETYAKKVLKQFAMEDCNSSKYPMEAKL
ncbi:uncharacterized protein LOC124930411 [Impatiens glandulifera]|uniref:uncharacterized protein LOC124930411 n=1 Tax=Impatiens glandulifera TaxID=253017 RepID=UPI001FB05C95|nr:uncharacterized protein LOC124930411 [Impatiens glandulifera]